MASTRQRGKYFYGRWRDRDGKDREKGGFLKRSEAYLYAVSQEKEALLGKNTSPSALNLTLFEYINLFWLKTLDVRPQTAVDYELSLNTYILEKFGEKRLSEIKQVDLKIWSVELKNKGLSPRTIEKHLNLLATVLNAAIASEHLYKSPFKGWKRGKARKRNEVVPLEYWQVEKIAATLAPRYRIMVWIGYYTGMRPSEVLGLTWDRVNFETKEIRIDRQISRDRKQVHDDYLKTEASRRTISLSKDLEGLLMNHQAKFGLGPNGLILQNRLGGVLRYHDASEMFRKGGRAAGLVAGQGMHQLRHTCASILIKSGMNIKAIQEWLGHASITETLDTYGHLFPKAMLALSDALDTYVAESREQNSLRIAE